MSEPLVFQEFDSIAEADKVWAMLKEAGIDASVERTKPRLLDDNFIGTKYDPPFQLKMRGEDFTRARKILLEKYTVNLDELDKNYMLLSFSNDELLDIIAKPDEWGFYNYNIANALLAQRGVAVNAEEKEALEGKRLKELSAPRQMNSFWLVVGYVTAVINCIAFANDYQNYMDHDFADGIWLLPGFLGFIIGGTLIYSKTTLPDGNRIFTNNATLRTHGRIILWANIISWTLNLILELNFVIKYYQ